MHCVSKVAELVLELLQGNKSNTEADRVLAAAQHVHNEWTSASALRSRLPWVLAQASIAAMEARLSAIMLPAGLSNDYKLQQVFHATLTSHQRTVWLTVYWKFISDGLLPSCYRSLVAQLSDDVSMLLSPAFERRSE